MNLTIRNMQQRRKASPYRASACASVLHENKIAEKSARDSLKWAREELDMQEVEKELEELVKSGLIQKCENGKYAALDYRP